MSLILDALKRAERERQGEGIPAPREVPVRIAGTAPAPPRVWLFAAAAAIAAVALVGVALGGWKVWKERSATAAPVPAAQEPAAAPPAIVARPAPPEPAPTVVPGTESVASLDDLSDEPTLEGPVAPASKPVPLVPAAKDPGPDVIATRPTTAPKVARPAEIPPSVAQAAPPKQTPPSVAQPAPQPEPAPPQPAAKPEPEPEAQAQATTPPPEIPPALTQPAPLRKFREMPPAYRADFPALKIEIHVYEKAQARRFVMINGRKYREGERLAEGPSLIEIVPDGIVFEYRGEKVLYTLGR